MDTRRRRAGVVVVAVVAGVALGGCPAQERICSSGEYPAKAVGNTTGRTCVRDGQGPPEGYVRYPAGKEPKFVDDDWDRYWRTVVVDRDGNIVSS
jgi:hypothetical protein